MDPFSHSAQSVLACCHYLSRYTETPGSIQRTFLCAPARDVHRHLGSWMERLGMTVSVDAVGNLRGLYPGSHPDARRIIIASHLDTVPNAGAYDGVLGVVLAISLVELLSGEKLECAIEVVGFSEEEGIRFGVPFLGSLALAGRFEQAILELRDPTGVSVAEAICAFGLNPDELPGAALHPNAAAYLEFHIEQGPVLDKAGLPLACVESIAGQTRAAVSFEGQANHAGTTPMALRRDAMCGAAEWILAVEEQARRIHGLVSTVGKIDAKPGAGNVISGLVHASLDVRHSVDEVRRHAYEIILRAGHEIARKRSLIFQQEVLLNQSAVVMSPSLVELAAESIAATGAPPFRMVSGGGHDAMIIAPKLPSAMIFVRSPGGISHHPNETVLLEDVQAALVAGNYFLRYLSI